MNGSGGAMSRSPKSPSLFGFGGRPFGGLEFFEFGEDGFGDVAVEMVEAFGFGEGGVEIDASFDAVVGVEQAVGAVNHHDIVNPLAFLGQIGSAYGVGADERDGIAYLVGALAGFVVDDDAYEIEIVVGTGGQKERQEEEKELFHWGAGFGWV